jgi:hypothetical protein
VLEGPKAIEDDGLGGTSLGSGLLVEEQAVATEAIAESPDGRVGDLELPCDLTECGAGDEAVEGRGE